MQRRVLAAARVIALLAAVTLMAALSSGVLQPIQLATGAPSAQRYPPEEFSGTVVTGSITSVGGVTKFFIDRPKKTGNTFDPTQREQVTAQLETAPAAEAALVVDGATLFFSGTYDPALGIFFVSRVGTGPAPVAVAPAPAAPGPTDNDDADNDDVDNDDADNDDVDNDDADNDDADNDDVDNDDADNDDADNDDADNDDADNDDADNDDADNDDADNDS